MPIPHVSLAFFLRLERTFTEGTVQLDVSVEFVLAVEPVSTCRAHKLTMCAFVFPQMLLGADHFVARSTLAVVLFPSVLL